MMLSGSSGGRAGAQAASEASKVLSDPNWPSAFPFKPEMFKRFDEEVDTAFYSAPRLVFHIDEPAVQAVTRYYKEAFPPSGNDSVAILDLCSSWVSHYPPGYRVNLQTLNLKLNSGEPLPPRVQGRQDHGSRDGQGTRA